MRELALHILDIAENSKSAGASKIEISINENLNNDWLEIVIEDNGKGMTEETLAHITDPFVTSRTTRKVGLGIPFFKAAAESCEGTFEIQSAPDKGTKVRAVFRHNHIDRMPLGDISSTFLGLMIGTPEVNWIFNYQVNDASFDFDDHPIKKTLDGVPLSEPAVMRYLREMIEEGIEDVRSKLIEK